MPLRIQTVFGFMRESLRHWTEETRKRRVPDSPRRWPIKEAFILSLPEKRSGRSRYSIVPRPMLWKRTGLFALQQQWVSLRINTNETPTGRRTEEGLWTIESSKTTSARTGESQRGGGVSTAGARLLSPVLLKEALVTSLVFLPQMSPEGWDYDTLYEVDIDNVAMQSEKTRSFSYAVFIERDNL